METRVCLEYSVDDGGLLHRKIGNFNKLQLPQSLIVFAKILHLFST